MTTVIKCACGTLLKVKPFETVPCPKCQMLITTDEKTVKRLAADRVVFRWLPLASLLLKISGSLEFAFTVFALVTFGANIISGDAPRIATSFVAAISLLIAGIVSFGVSEGLDTVKRLALR